MKTYRLAPTKKSYKFIKIDQNILGLQHIENEGYLSCEICRYNILNVYKYTNLIFVDLVTYG